MHRIWVMALLTTFGVLAWTAPTFAQEAAEEEAKTALEEMRAELGAPPQLTARTQEAVESYRSEAAAWQERRDALYAAFIEEYAGTDAARRLQFELAVGKMRSSGGDEEKIREVASELSEIAEAAKDPQLKAEAYYYCGSALKELGRYDEAIATLEKAAKQSQDERLTEYANKGRYAAKVERDGLLDIGKKPIDFEVTALDGETTISPDMYEGKVVLIDFWATWCGPCIRELPVVKETYAQFHDKGFEIIGISLDNQGDKKKLEDFIEQREMPWVQYFDGKGWSNEVAGLYAVNSIPATFLLDQKGKIVAKDLRGEALPKKVAELLGEQYEPKGEGGGEQPAMGQRPVVGDMLPAFEAMTTAGKKVSPETLKGKIVLVDFWATWCPPCVAELPHVKETYAKFKDEGFTVLGISLDEPRNISLEKLNDFVEKRELGWPMVYESGMAIAQKYGITAIPSTFLVDASGKIRATDLRGDALKEKVAELVAEQ